MKILLDTHIAIWAVLDSEELPDEARAMILDEDNEIYYSAASVWEIPCGRVRSERFYVIANIR